MEHFVFPGKFTIGESRATSVQMTQNSKRKTLHGILAGEDFPSKLLWRTPTKIHRERKRRRQQGNGEAERASLAQRRQRRQHSDHNMYRGSDKILQLHCKWNRGKKGDTDFRRFKKRWGDQATLEVYCQNYLLQCNGRQQQLHDLYARTEDSRQPLHHEQQWFFIVLSFISLQWTVYNTDNVWHVGERYICK